MTLIRLVYFSILFLGSTTLFAECQSQRVKVQVLGSGGPELSDARASSSYLIWLDGRGVLLIDTGAGSSLNYEKSGAKLVDLQALAFSHFHVDHSADFPALIKGSYFTERQQNLLVFGPEGNAIMPSTTEFINRMIGINGAFPYLSDYVVAKESSQYKVIGKNIALAKHRKQTIYTAKDFLLQATPVHHGPIPALAWRVDMAGCSIAFSGDMSNKFQTLSKLAKGVDILIAHNAISESQGGIARALHMPPSEIGKIAAQARVKKLVLSHRMKRTLGREQQTKSMIRKYYQGSLFFAEDMDLFTPEQ